MAAEEKNKLAGRAYGLGLVGAGSFGQFCLNAFRKMPNLKLAAVCDKDLERARAVAAEFGMAPYNDLELLLADQSVDIVAIDTPPASHAALSMAALRAGKHVFCEKPLATSLEDAAAVLRMAEAAGAVFSLDYVMRANPLYRLIKRLGELKAGGAPVLGTLRRGSLENLAADESLDPQHWFWDPALSGGIFVEHGVHFFDLFGWQLGRAPDRVIAMAKTRAGGLIDTVQAVVDYEGGATSSSFHSFSHARAGEFQAIVFGWDWAAAELHGWIALDLHLEALLTAQGLELLAEALAPGETLLALPGEPDLPGANLSWQVVERFAGSPGMVGRGEERGVCALVEMKASLGGMEAKLTVYEQGVRAGMAALISAIEDGRSWVIPPADLWSSTAAAIAARESAASGQMVSCRRLN